MRKISKERREKLELEKGKYDFISYFNKPFTKEFYSMQFDQKLAYIKANPSAIFFIDKNIIPDSMKMEDEMYKLKQIALSRDGSLLLHFANAGLYYDQNLVFSALHTYPEIIKFLDEKFIDEEVAKAALRKNIALAMYIPVSMMTTTLYNYANRYIRKNIKENPKLFWTLPQIMQEMSFSACSVYINKDFDIVERLTNDQLNLNNGKILYQIAKKDPKAIMKLDQSVWRRNLMKVVVSAQPELFAELPEKYRLDPLIQFYTYKAVLKQNKMNTFEAIFSDSSKQALDKKLAKVAKNKGMTVQELLESEKQSSAK